MKYKRLALLVAIGVSLTSLGFAGFGYSSSLYDYIYGTNSPTAIDANSDGYLVKTGTNQIGYISSSADDSTQANYNGANFGSNTFAVAGTNGLYVTEGSSSTIHYIGLLDSGNSGSSIWVQPIGSNSVNDVDAETDLYTANKDGRWFRVDEADGSEVWSYNPSEGTPSDVDVDGSYVYGSVGSTIYKLHRSNGSVVWSKTAPNSVNKLTYGDGNFYTASGSNLYKYDTDLNQLASNSVGTVNEIDYVSNEVFVSDSNGFKDLDTSLNIVDSYNNGETQTELSINGGYVLHNGNGGTAKAFEYQAPLTADIVTDYSNVQPGESIGVDVEVPPDHESGSGNYTLYEQGTDVASGSLSFDGSYFSATNIYSVKESKNYTVDVQIDSGGSTATDSVNFSVPNLPPTINSISTEPSPPPFNETLGIRSNISDATGVDTVTASVSEDGTEIATGINLNFNSSSGLYEADNVFDTDQVVDYNITVEATDAEGLTSRNSYVFTPNVDAPNPDTLSESPKLYDANRLDSLDVNVSGTVGDFPVDRVNVKIWNSATNSIYANKSVTDVTQGSSRGDSFSIEETDLIDITKDIEGNDVLFGATVYDTNGNTGVVGADITETSASGITQTVGTYSDPTIQNFNVTPSISSASVGDQFDVSVDGDVGENSIDKVTYRLAVTNAVDPDPITKSPNFQDQNGFTDSVSNAFEFKDAYKGETLTFKVEVNDTLGYEDTAQISDTQYPPPDSFIQLRPDQGQVFLIAEGETNTSVDVEYGVDTSNNGGTVELLVNGNVEDSFSVSGNTQETRIKTLTLNEGSYDWKVRFTDGTTGEVYTSSNKVFEVTDEPIALSLDSPTGTISITNDTTTTIDHDFDVDARAYSGNYFYDFELTNDDTNTVVSSRTSPDNSGGNIDSFTESVAGLDESNYTWSVEVKRSSDGLLLESSNVSYTIEANPKFNGNIKKPSDGERFSIAENVTNRDVNATYFLDTKASDVDATLYLNGNEVESRTVSSNSYQTFDVTLQDLTDGDYTLRLFAEDSGGRTINKTVDFQIVRTAEEQIEFTEIRTTPSLEEATVGDEVDVYFEGTGNISDVDFVQFEITSDGETIKTLTVPREDLQEGSWFGTIDAAFTVTEELLGTDLGILGEANSVEGYTTSFFLNAVLGSDRSISAGLDVPPDGKTFGQTDGNVEPIRYDFDVTTVSYPVNWTLQAKEVGGSWQDVKDGNVTKTNSTVDVSAFVNHDTKFGKQFGDFAYRVKLVETSSAPLDSPDKFTSPSRTYSIVNESEQPVILNLNKPEKNGVYYADTAADDTDVPFDFDVDTPEQGTLSVVVDGREIYTKQVSDGFTSDRFDERLGVGTYDANITFESSSYFESVENTFSVEQEPDDKSEAFVKLKEPSDGRTLYQNFGNRFAWKVFNPATNNDSVSPEGTTTLFIKNENGDVVETFDREYNTQNEVNVFSNLYDTDLNIGSYTFQANFSSPSLDSTITSEVRSFTVADFKPPTSTLGDPENDTFASNDSVAFDWTTTSYQEAPTVRLKVRKVDDYEATTYFESSQGATETRDYDFNTSEFEVGTYEWFIEMELDGGATFESSAQKFTIEPNQIKPPVYDLKEPEQGTKYDSGSDNKTDVSFVYDVTGFSKTDATVELLVQEVVDGGGEGFEVVDSNIQNDADGTVSYNYTKSLDDGGYRWKVRVEYPNGQTNESDPISFAVGEDSTVPKAEPTEGLIDAISKFAGDLNSEFKNAVGKMGQYFVATALVIGLSGAVHLAFKVRFLTALTSSLLAVGFSLADGYYPLAMFWIVLALAATLAGMFAVRVSKGDS